MKSALRPLILAFAGCIFTAASSHCQQQVQNGVSPGTAPLPADPAAALLPAPLGPKIQFQDQKEGGNLFDAGKVLVTQPLKHTFFFTNVGDQVLEVTKVTGTCGCTVAGEYTKKVEPGQSGQIPIQVNLSPSWGGTMTKTATIECNDKTKQPVSINLRFTVWKPVDVSQQFVTLNVQPDSDNYPSTSVRVENNMEQPLDVFSPASDNKNFAVDIKTNEPGKHYELVIRAVGPFNPGQNVSGQITAKTSATNMPEVRLTAMAMVPQPVTVIPSMVMLEAQPLAAESKKTITITYNGGKSLALSEPAFSAKGVDVLLSETRPGHEFKATLTFPAGFEAQGRPLQFTVKSSNPGMPVINVPVTPMQPAAHPVVPKPTSAAVPPIQPTVTAAKPAGVTAPPPTAGAR